MRYKLTRSVLSDIEAVALYVARDSESAAHRFVEAIFHRLEMLQKAPRAGRRRDDLGNGYRSVAVGQYLIFYKVGDTMIEVARVIHGRRDIHKDLKSASK